MAAISRRRLALRASWGIVVRFIRRETPMARVLRRRNGVPRAPGLLFQGPARLASLITLTGLGVWRKPTAGLRPGRVPLLGVGTVRNRSADNWLRSIFRRLFFGSVAFAGRLLTSAMVLDDLSNSFLVLHVARPGSATKSGARR